MEHKDQILDHDGVSSALNEHEVRCEKVKNMQAVGIDPWPSYKKVSTTLLAAKEDLSLIHI